MTSEESNEPNHIMGRTVDLDNDHRPVLGTAKYPGLYVAAWDCSHEGCRHTVGIPSETSKTVYKFHFLEEHTVKYNHDRTLDISVDWEISAMCNVCEDQCGTVVVVDTETIRCVDCGTTWSMDGTNGHRKESDG